MRRNVLLPGQSQVNSLHKYNQPQQSTPSSQNENINPQQQHRGHQQLSQSSRPRPPNQLLNNNLLGGRANLLGNSQLLSQQPKAQHFSQLGSQQQQQQQQQRFTPSTPQSNQFSAQQQLMSQQTSVPQRQITTPQRQMGTPIRHHSASQSQADAFENEASQLFDQVLFNTLNTIVTNSQSQTQHTQSHVEDISNILNCSSQIDPQDIYSTKNNTQYDAQSCISQTLFSQQQQRPSKQSQQSQPKPQQLEQSPPQKQQLLSQLLLDDPDEYDPNSLLTPAIQPALPAFNRTVGALKKNTAKKKGSNDLDSPSQSNNDLATPKQSTTAAAAPPKAIFRKSSSTKLTKANKHTAEVVPPPVINKVTKASSNANKVILSQSQSQVPLSPAQPPITLRSTARSNSGITTISTNEDDDDDDDDNNTKGTEAKHVMKSQGSPLPTINRRPTAHGTARHGTPNVHRHQTPGGMFISPMSSFGVTPMLATPTPFGRLTTPMGIHHTHLNNRIGALNRPKKMTQNEDYLSNDGSSHADDLRSRDSKFDNGDKDESDDELEMQTAWNTKMNKVEAKQARSAAVSKQSMGAKKSTAALRSVSAKAAQPQNSTVKPSSSTLGPPNTVKSSNSRSDKNKSKSTRSTGTVVSSKSSKALSSSPESRPQATTTTIVQKKSFIRKKTMCESSDDNADSDDNDSDDEDGIPAPKRNKKGTVKKNPTKKTPQLSSPKPKPQRATKQQRVHHSPRTDLPDFGPSIISTRGRTGTRPSNDEDDEKDDDLNKLYIHPIRATRSKAVPNVASGGINGNDRIFVETSAPFLKENDLLKLQGGMLYTDEEIELMLQNWEQFELKSLADSHQTTFEELKEQVDNGEVDLEKLRKQTSQMYLVDHISTKPRQIDSITIQKTSKLKKKKLKMGDDDDDDDDDNNANEGQQDQDESEDEIILRKPTKVRAARDPNRPLTIRDAQHEAAKTDEALAYKLAFGHSPVQSSMNGMYLPHEEMDWQMKFFNDIDAQSLFAESGFHLYSEDDSTNSDSDYEPGYGPSNRKRGAKTAAGNYKKSSRHYRRPNSQVAVLKARQYEEKVAASFTVNLGNAYSDPKLVKTAISCAQVLNRKHNEEVENLKRVDPHIFDESTDTSDSEDNHDVEDVTDGEQEYDDNGIPIKRTKKTKKPRAPRKPSDPNAPKRGRKPRDPNAPKVQRKPKKDPVDGGNGRRVEPIILQTKARGGANLALLGGSKNKTGVIGGVIGGVRGGENSNGLDPALAASLRPDQQRGSILENRTKPAAITGSTAPVSSKPSLLDASKGKRNSKAPQLGPDGIPIGPPPKQPRKQDQPQLDENGLPIPPKSRAKAPPKLDENGNPIPPKGRAPKGPQLDEDGQPIGRPQSRPATKRKASELDDSTTPTMTTTTTSSTVNMSTTLGTAEDEKISPINKKQKTFESSAAETLSSQIDNPRIQFDHETGEYVEYVEEYVDYEEDMEMNGTTTTTTQFSQHNPTQFTQQQQSQHFSQLSSQIYQEEELYDDDGNHYVKNVNGEWVDSEGNIVEFADEE